MAYPPEFLKLVDEFFHLATRLQGVVGKVVKPQVWQNLSERPRL